MCNSAADADHQMLLQVTWTNMKNTGAWVILSCSSLKSVTASSLLINP